MPVVGEHLGPYEILSEIGAGGMGVVFRARDTRLERIVAIKILSSHLAGSDDSQQRFVREARALSSLSHPNICQLYDVGQQDGINYLVMEFLQGETLADRLLKGPLPLDQVFKVGMEVCEALEVAHRSGVVHRDLKPANIMLTKSGTKLMDFGLAKAKTGSSVLSFSSPSLVTISQPLTTEGTIVGTFHYMAPEQLEGKEADIRSDVFALGAVLHEMITGRRAFQGTTAASTIAAILAAEPQPISAIQPLSPPALEHVVKTCLAKDPEERWQTAHDVRVELRWLAQDRSPSQQIRRQRRGPGLLGYAGWFVAALMLIIGGAAWWIDSQREKHPMYFTSPVHRTANNLVLSPDGKTVAMVAYSDQSANYVLWTYEIGSLRAAVIPGTEGATHPFWSPDGRSIGFFADGKLKTIDAFTGKSARVLCDALHGRGGTWNRDGTIIFSPDTWVGLSRVSAAGGTPVPLTKPQPALSEMSHRWPVFLPDGKHFLYLAANFAGEFSKNTIYLASLDSGERHALVAASSNAVYADPGYLLYMRDHALVAQRFDVRNATLSGEQQVLSDEVQYFPAIDLGLFAVAGKETLVLQTGKGADKAQLLWFDRSGKQIGVAGPPGLMANPKLSPDDRRVAFELTDRDGRHIDIWIRDLADDATRRLTFGPALAELPTWSPDGKRVMFMMNRDLQGKILEKNADGSGLERELGDPTQFLQAVVDGSRDGKSLLLWRNGELWYLTASEKVPKPIFRGDSIVSNAQFSPDGKWIAYTSNESGSWEVYVSPFPEPTTKWQVSSGGGTQPRWRQDGKELFYLSTEGKMMSVAVRSSSSFEAGVPTSLFQTHIRQGISAAELFSYDVAADGQRFLVNTKVDEPNPAPLFVILNWASELQK
jgi:serine/threonine protein kinase/Tol biopolymer transport system component